MKTIAKATKGKTIFQPRTGRRYTILTTKPQCMNYYAVAPEDPTYRVMVRPAQGSAFDLFINQADLDANHYVIE